MKKLKQYFRQRTALSHKREEEELPYMSRVDAALQRRGRIGPVFLSLGTLGLVVLLLIWAAWADLDEVTRGQGQVVAAQRTQIIQNLEGGILREIMVREGAVVEKNQPLARLDDLGAASPVSRRHEQGPGKPGGPGPPGRRKKTKPSPSLTRHCGPRPRRLWPIRRKCFKPAATSSPRKSNCWNPSTKQRLNDVDEQRGRKIQMEGTLALAEERRDIAKPLVERKLFSKVDYLDLEQKVLTLHGDIEALSSTMAKAAEAAQEAQRKLSLRKAEMEAQISEEINKRRTELTSLQETLSAGSDRVTRTELRSPVRGTVKQIVLNTLGGVVRPGEPIMEVVPLDDTLLVEVRVRPRISPSSTLIKRPWSRFRLTITPSTAVLKPGWSRSAPDTIEDRKGEFYYLVKLRTKKNAISYRNEQLPIIPGMVATVDIISGKKSILDYLLKPILKARQNALRER